MARRVTDEGLELPRFTWSICDRTLTARYRDGFVLRFEKEQV
jgi:hypothetical protein